MDGDAVRKSLAALRKENAALKAQLAAVPRASGTELATVADTGDASPDQIVAPKTKEDAMKQLVADESLSEEARESAKKALEVLVSSQLLDIEQAAAHKKRAGELKELESEAQFTKAEAEASIRQTEADLKKVEAESEGKAAVDNMKEDQETLAASKKEMKEWLRSHRLQDYAADVTRIGGSCVALCLAWARPG